MKAQVDPYQDWLHISTRGRAPTHYELLGLPAFSDDPQAAHNAAIERIAHVRKYQTGKHSELAIRVMNEISQALTCLRDPAAKRAYDRLLRGADTVEDVTVNALTESGLEPPREQTDDDPSLAALSAIVAATEPLPLASPYIQAKAVPEAPNKQKASDLRRAPLVVVAGVAAVAVIIVAISGISRLASSGKKTDSTIVADAGQSSGPSRSPEEDRPQPKPPPAGSGETPIPPATQTPLEPTLAIPFGADGSIDLLKLIDPTRDAVAGEWRCDGKTLITGARRCDRLEIPFEVPAEYKLTVVAYCHSHREALHLGLVAGSHQVLAVLDGWGKTVTCLQLVDGRDAIPHHGPVLRDREPNVITCAVRANQISVDCNGTRVLDWTGDFNRLTIRPDWRVRGAKHLFIGSWDTPFEISKLELSPL